MSKQPVYKALLEYNDVQIATVERLADILGKQGANNEGLEAERERCMLFRQYYARPRGLSQALQLSARYSRVSARCANCREREEGKQ